MPTPAEDPGSGEPASRGDLEFALAVRGDLLDELDWLARRLEQSNQVLQRFAGGVAHDLKAPIANLIGYGELLVDLVGDLDPYEHGDLVTVAERVEANARRAMDIVQELMEYALETSDPGPLQSDLGDVVEWVLETLADDIDRAGATIVARRPLLPVAVHEAAARQLVVNLVSNALRHARPGVEPVVTITTGSIEPFRVRMRISDNGPGIESSRREEVFEFGISDRFGGGGTGIGLAACRASVVDHGGRIWIEDGDDGVGTAVLVELPAPANDAGAVRPATVFVAHPSAEVSATARLLGRRFGFGVVAEATTPGEAMAAYGALPERPDLVLVADRFAVTADAGVPDTAATGGFDLATEIRLLEPDQAVLVVAHTADGESVARAGEVDGVVSLTEPGSLSAAIQDALSVRRR